VRLECHKRRRRSVRFVRSDQFVTLTVRTRTGDAQDPRLERRLMFLHTLTMILLHTNSAHDTHNTTSHGEAEGRLDAFFPFGLLFFLIHRIRHSGFVRARAQLLRDHGARLI
jgi:hypothetical protein